MERLELTKRWTVVNVFEQSENKFLEEGLEIEYYFENNDNINNPSRGVVKKDDVGYFIEWEDKELVTRIDDSHQSKKILGNCGWL